MTATDERIETLTAELARLRNSNQQADDQLHALLLRMTEVQLSLAAQDRLLAKLELTLNGNGRPGLVLRLDRTERIAANLVKAVWLLTATAVTEGIRLLTDHFR
jgi:hypothetical protein